MSHLFATTDLERNYRLNFNVIGLDRRPKVLGLKPLLAEWLKFRTETVRRRIEFRLERIRRRLHVVEGLLVAYLNLDEVIRIIREEDAPKPRLMERFDLSDEQATAILDLRLRQLAKLEEAKLREERDELTAEADGLNQTLASRARMRTLIKKEITADAEKYGDDRRTEIATVAEAEAFSETDLLSTEPVTVVLSEKGWVRAAKGHDIDPEELSYRSGDSFAAAARGKTNDACVFFDSTGRAYNLAPHTLPSARGQGEPLSGKLKIPDGARFVGLSLGEPTRKLLVASSSGYGFVTSVGDVLSKNRAGKAVLNVPAGAVALRPVSFDAATLVAAATSEGRLLVFPLEQVPVLGRGKGQKLISIPPKAYRETGEHVVAVAPLGDGDQLLVRAGARHTRLRFRDLENYRGNRAQRGRLLPRGFQRVDQLDVE